MNDLKFLFPFIILLLLVGCSSDKTENRQNDFKLVASERTLPTDFEELAQKSEEFPFGQYLVKKVNNQKEYEALWILYELENQMVKVNFDEKDVLFIGLYESGSCPFEIEKREMEKNTLRLHLLNPLGNCTSDASPRTFVIQLEKEQSKEMTSVEIIENNLETMIPLNH